MRLSLSDRAADVLAGYSSILILFLCLNWQINLITWAYFPSLLVGLVGIALVVLLGYHRDLPDSETSKLLCSPYDVLWASVILACVATPEGSSIDYEMFVLSIIAVGSVIAQLVMWLFDATQRRLGRMV